MASQMTFATGYSISALWGPHAETPGELADRWIALIERLQALDPVFANWSTWTKQKRFVPYKPQKPIVSAAIASLIGTSEDGSPDPDYGYRYSGINSPPEIERSRRFHIDLRAGSPSVYGTNSVNLETDYSTAPDPDVITYKIFRGAVLALGECFNAMRVTALPVDLSELWPKNRRWQPTLQLAWISYVAPRYAHLITPPSTTIVEYQPDGGLLMAATDETFVTSNPAHLAVARDIQAACAPFNALPYPPE